MHIHFIGIGGSAITPIAISMKHLGHKVTGSDENVFDPALTLLNNENITWYEGYSADKVADADLVIMGGAPLMKDHNNPEYLEAMRLGKQIEGYAYLVSKYIIKSKSIVLAGSYGKSTTAGIVSWILENGGYDPSFMIGGKPQNFDSGVKVSNSDISVIEGDEFVSVFGIDMEPRFIYYKPKFTLISSSKWDHTNVYPTEESYFEAYLKLINLTIKNEGVLFLSLSGENNQKLYDYAKDKIEVITYFVEGLTKNLDIQPDLIASNTKFDRNGSVFTVKGTDVKEEEYKTSLVGLHNTENFLGSIAICRRLGVDSVKIKEGIATYKGIKRRLELVGVNSRGSIILDDFAHSPMKALASINAVRECYPDKKIVSIYLPRISSLENREELPFYANSFDNSDIVIIPRIKVKRSVPKENRVYGGDIYEVISQTNPKTFYMPDDNELKKKLDELSDDKAVFLYMSAADWKESIEFVKAL